MVVSAIVSLGAFLSFDIVMLPSHQITINIRYHNCAFFLIYLNEFRGSKMIEHTIGQNNKNAIKKGL